ncbi:MAG: alkaline phosphatase family protein, partial [Candidatus Diapherotrites archaeon]|nr:alkaline phosphatase family protein [Candidatus Diapherotrites archaeon]
DQKPEMSAAGIADAACQNIATKKYDFILINFANADLVGHSANIPAIIKGIETIDQCLSRIGRTAFQNGYPLIVTSDHGNAEEKRTPQGEKIPSHSTNPVPFILASPDPDFQPIKLHDGELIDVAPTMLKLMNQKIPREMTGRPLY